MPKQPKTNPQKKPSTTPPTGSRRDELAAQTARDTRDRKIRRLEIELEAHKKDEAANIGKDEKGRMKEIEQEIAELRAQTADLEVKWKNEKESLKEIGTIKKELESLRAEAESAEARLQGRRPPRTRPALPVSATRIFSFFIFSI